MSQEDLRGLRDLLASARRVDAPPPPPQYAAIIERVSQADRG